MHHGLAIWVSTNLYSQAPFGLDKELISKDSLNNICDDDLRWLRNEIYARHGYVFSNRKYQSHFEQFDWYKPQNKKVKLLQIELDNAFILQKEEVKRKVRTKVIMSFLEDLKVGISYNDSTVIEILNKVYIYDIQFCGSKNVSVEHKEDGFILAKNGKDKITNRRYSVSIGRNKISIEKSYYQIIPTGGEDISIELPRCIYFEFYIDSKNKIDQTPILVFCN